MNKIISFILGAVLVGSAQFAFIGHAYAVETKIAVVDMQNALHGTKAGKQARKRFEDAVKAKEKELKPEQDSIKALNEEIQKGASIMSKDALAKKRQEFAGRFQQYQMKANQVRTNMKNQEDVMIRKILVAMQEVVREMASEQALDLVVDSATVLYVKPAHNMTKAVIAAFNKRYSGYAAVEKFVNSKLKK